jgi:transcriptional regulator
MNIVELIDEKDREEYLKLKREVEFLEAQMSWLEASKQPMTFEEIGNELGISEGAANQIYLRAMKKIREQLTPEKTLALLEMMRPNVDTYSEDWNRFLTTLEQMDVEEDHDGLYNTFDYEEYR